MCGLLLPDGKPASFLLPFLGFWLSFQLLHALILSVVNRFIFCFLILRLMFSCLSNLDKTFTKQNDAIVHDDTRSVQELYIFFTFSS